MCGIVGAVYGPEGPDAQNEWSPNDAAEIMFPEVEHRGKDAFGWMWYRGSSDDIRLRKAGGRASDALDLLDVPADTRWWIGHVRLATHGSPLDSRNNHPLQHGMWLGVHNGVIRNYEEILKDTGREDPAVEVDSEALLAAVDRYGLVPGLKRVRGSAAAVLINRAKPAQVHLARASQSPLWVGRTASGSRYFASERQILQALEIEFESGPHQVREQTVLTIRKNGRVVRERWGRTSKRKTTTGIGTQRVCQATPWERSERQYERWMEELDQDGLFCYHCGAYLDRVDWEEEGCMFCGAVPMWS